MLGTIRKLKQKVVVWQQELRMLDNKDPSTLGLALLLECIPEVKEYLERRFRSDEFRRLDLIAAEVASFVSEWGYEREGAHRTRRDVVDCCVYHFERKGLSVTSQGDEPGPGVIIRRKEITAELMRQILENPEVGYGFPPESVGKDLDNKSFLGFSLRRRVPRKTSRLKAAE